MNSAHLGKAQGFENLYFKNEALNPTGSYKDRIATVSMSQLVEQGKEMWVTTSSGNAGASTAAYGVRAGVDGYLFTLERAPRAKIAQIIAYGPHTDDRCAGWAMNPPSRMRPGPTAFNSASRAAG